MNSPIGVSSGNFCCVSFSISFFIILYNAGNFSLASSFALSNSKSSWLSIFSSSVFWIFSSCFNVSSFFCHAL